MLRKSDDIEIRFFNTHSKLAEVLINKIGGFWPRKDRLKCPRRLRRRLLFRFGLLMGGRCFFRRTLVVGPFVRPRSHSRKVLSAFILPLVLKLAGVTAAPSVHSPLSLPFPAGTRSSSG